jgi:hypothetical protein
MEGPVGKLASSWPIWAVNSPNRLWPPKPLTGMLAGMVQLHRGWTRAWPRVRGRSRSEGLRAGGLRNTHMCVIMRRMTWPTAGGVPAPPAATADCVCWGINGPCCGACHATHSAAASCCACVRVVLCAPDHADLQARAPREPTTQPWQCTPVCHAPTHPRKPSTGTSGSRLTQSAG